MSDSHNDTGTASTPSEAAMGESVARILGGKVAVVNVSEGQEPAEFWTFLGGKGPYPATSKGGPLPRDARLFQASTASGSFKVEEVANFDQSDLLQEDVFLLDTYTQLFLWIGEGATEEEKGKGLIFANKFIKEAGDGRDVSCPVITVPSGNEPSMFTAHFLGWNKDLAAQGKFEDVYEKLKKLTVKTA